MPAALIQKIQSDPDKKGAEKMRVYYPENYKHEDDGLLYIKRVWPSLSKWQQIIIFAMVWWASTCNQLHMPKWFTDGGFHAIKALY
jgi:hypothetical protein